MDTPKKQYNVITFLPPPYSLLSPRKWDEMKAIVDVDKKEKGLNFLMCTKIFSQCHPSLSFLPSIFLSCKNTFMGVKSR